MATKSDRSLLHVDEPPDADPHVRVVWGAGEKNSRLPDYKEVEKAMKRRNFISLPFDFLWKHAEETLKVVVFVQLMSLLVAIVVLILTALHVLFHCHLPL